MKYDVIKIIQALAGVLLFSVVEVGVGCNYGMIFCTSIEMPEALGLFLIAVRTCNWELWFLK